MRTRRGSTLALLTGLACAAGLASGVQPAAAATAGDCGTSYGFASDETFFTTAALGNTTNPGDIQKCRMIQVFDSKFPAGTQAWQLIYRSKDANGNAIAVSGTILVPPAPAGGIKGIVSAGTATTGAADKIGNTASCAPSAGIPDGGAIISNPVRDYLNAGYAVAVTDYEGLRTPGTHKYVVGRSAGQTMLDVVRAAHRLPSAGLAGKPTIFAGYSQGAHAALWAAQLEQSYAPELDVRGAVANSAPVNIISMLNSVDGALASGIMAYAIRSYNDQYPELNLWGRLNANGRAWVTNNQNRCLAAQILGFDAMFQPWNTLWTTGQNPRNTPLFIQRANENNVPPANPTVPLYMTHGDADGIAPYAPHRALYDSWVGKPGVDVSWHTIPGGTHTALSNEDGRAIAMPWMAQRFDAPPQQ